MAIGVLCSRPAGQMPICKRCKRLKPVAEFNQKADGSHTVRCTYCSNQMSKYQSKYLRTAKGKAKMKRSNASEAYVRSKAKHKASEKCTKTTAAYRASDHYKKLRAAEYKRTHSDPGRHLEHAVGVVMGHMLDGKRDTSRKVLDASGFSNGEELWAHLESTFDEGMTFENHGRYVKGGPPVWHIGHRIARWHFDPTTHPEDMKRCWSPANLFAQWGIDNLKAKVRFPKEEELLHLKECWPTAWGSELPSAEERTAMEEKVFASCGKYHALRV